jgi:hypothetical protein
MAELTAAQKKAFMDLPLMKEIKKNYMEAQRMSGSGKKMRGGSWWNDVGNWFKQAAVDADAWLKKTKALSTVGKVVGAIGMIPGLNEFAPVGAAVAKAGEALGYGRRKGGRKIDARSFASHVNPVAGSRGLVSVGMGSMVQNFQSPGLRMMNGGATFPSHLQPFLKKGRSIKGFGVSQAVGSIGNPGKIKA